MSTPRRLLVVTGLICCTTIVSHSFGRSTYGLLIPAIEDDMGISHAQAGLPSTGTFLAYILGVLLVTATAPRVEPISIMRFGLASAAVGLFMASISPGLAMLTLGVAIAGGSGAGIWLTAPVLATAHVPPARRGMVIGLLSSSIGLSNIILGFGTTALRDVADDDELWRPVFAIEAGLAVLLLVALVALARYDRTDRIAGGFSLELLKHVPAAGRITFAYGCFGAMAAGFGAFMLVALEEQGDMARSTTTVVFSLAGIAGVLGAPVAGAVSDRIGRRSLMLVALAALITANLLVALGSGVVVAAGVVLFGGAAGSFPALVATYVRDHVNDRSFSRVMATMTILFSVLAAATPATMGAIADTTDGFRIPYLILAGVITTAFVLVRALPDIVGPDSAGPSAVASHS